MITTATVSGPTLRWRRWVRIDPDQATSEVWWYGLRNPLARFWIDQPTGLVYIADVGQNAYEEISVAELSEPNLNFGWPITEGLHCFEPRRDCDTEGLTLPVLEVPHTDRGTCSVTGGIVYRGAVDARAVGPLLLFRLLRRVPAKLPLERRFGR